MRLGADPGVVADLPDHSDDADGGAVGLVDIAVLGPAVMRNMSFDSHRPRSHLDRLTDQRQRPGGQGVRIHAVNRFDSWSTVVWLGFLP